MSRSGFTLLYSDDFSSSNSTPFRSVINMNIVETRPILKEVPLVLNLTGSVHLKNPRKIVPIVLGIFSTRRTHLSSLNLDNLHREIDAQPADLRFNL